MAYPNHFELRFLGLSGPNWSLSMLIFQHPPIISTQIDFQNFEIFVLSYSDLIDIHGWSELLNNEGTTQFWMEQAFWCFWTKSRAQAIFEWNRSGSFEWGWRNDPCFLARLYFFYTWRLNMIHARSAQISAWVQLNICETDPYFHQNF